MLKLCFTNGKKLIHSNKAWLKCIVLQYNILFQGFVGYLGILHGDPKRIIYGADSWGNTCNKRNDPIPNVTYSGRDTTGLRYNNNVLEYYFNIEDATSFKYKFKIANICDFMAALSVYMPFSFQ